MVMDPVKKADRKAPNAMLPSYSIISSSRTTPTTRLASFIDGRRASFVCVGEITGQSTYSKCAYYKKNSNK